MIIYFRLNEPYVKAVVKQLNDHLQDAINFIDQDANDGILIAGPGAVQVAGYIPTPKALNHFPTVGVRTGAGQLVDDTGGGGTWWTRVVIACFVQDADQQRMGIRLQRLADAVANVAYPRERQYQDPDSPIWGMNKLEVDPGPTLNRNEDPRDWMSYTAVSFSVRGEADQFA